LLVLRAPAFLFTKPHGLFPDYGKWLPAIVWKDNHFL
jgi:hypothetical protein